MKLEKMDVPAVSIVTEPFIATGQAMAKNWGAPDYAFLVTPHPIANLNEAQLDARADELTDQVVTFFMRKP